MKILLVSTHFQPDRAGGTPESVRLTAAALGQAGHHVTVVTPAWSPGVAPAGPYRVVQVPISGLYDHGSERRFLNPRYHAAFGAAIAALAPEADVIHAQDRRAILATWLGRRGRPAVATLRDVGLLCPVALCLWDGRTGVCRGLRARAAEHTRFFRLYGADSVRRADFRLWLRRAWLALERRVAHRFAAVAYVSEGLRLLHHASGFQAAREAVLYSPVEAGDTPSSPTALLWAALYVGKPSPGKGWPEFLAAVQRFPRLRFAQAGPVPPGPMPDNCVPFGPLPRPHLAEVQRVSASVAVPSRTPDALPRAALEAQALGVPVVGTRVGGIPEIVEHCETGFLVPPGDPAALADGIDALWRMEPYEADRMRQHARACTLQRFGFRPTAEAHVRAYHEALAQ